MTFLLLYIESRLPKLLHFSVGVVLLVLLTSTFVTNELYAQVSPNIHHSAVANTSNVLQHQSSPNKIHGVKITSPTKAQQVATGKNLVVSGTSADNTTSDCNVSVIVNGVKPYRLVSANGSAGAKDYSKWNFTLTPVYTSIKQGQNKITAKFSCTNEPNLIAHSSVNVTGVSTTLNPVTNQQNTGKNSTTSNVNTASIDNATTSSTSFSHPNIANTNNITNGNSTMSISVHLGKKSIQPGDKQSIVIKVTDSNSTIPVAGASVLGRVTDPSGVSFKKFAGTTDDSGKSSYAWTASQGDTSGKYKTIINVSAHGYKNTTVSKTFQIIPGTTTTTSNTNLNQLFAPKASDSNNNQNSPSTIIPIPQLPKIKVPFHLPFQ
ncbi:MAG TPA: hypothetical protein VFI73_10300 [Candidatus Nitrosopolaris sp.]|nr:hypothetical protein [Candidatus Nitrosopolaris sp.]